ncbi:MAG TPA: sigma-54 dependent transcriptional regulator [Vicinamibacteria bacterium]|nr:sigma-54 dependent transcriptional regulator [Vicinamibacteria bacterium]
MSRARVLVIDDEPDMAESVRLILQRAGYQAQVETDARRGLATVQAERPDLVVTDIRMPEMSGIQLIEAMKARQLTIPVIVLTGFASVDSAVEAMRLGATDYLPKPFSPDELLLRVERALLWNRMAEENRALREHIASVTELPLVGASPALGEVLRLVEKVAPTDTRVLIVGESGTGKELLARTIHARGPRRGMPFHALNCGALTETLLESELFGHERGSFTGAVATKKGFFEVANGGTLFLDEVSETSSAFQTNLLRVIQEGEFHRVGATRPIRTDVRVLASTNRDPKKAIAEGRLRDDLYYRLAVVQITLPPLRERVEDVPLLAAHFVEMYARQIKKRVPGIEADAMEALRRYPWPGNIRELENVVERAIIMAEDGAPISASDLPDDLVVAAIAETAAEAAPPGPAHELREAERDVLLRVLRECNWNRSLAARRLGIGRRTLYDKLARHGIALRAPA